MAKAKINAGLAQARAFVLRRQMLDGRGLPNGEAGALEAVRRLGYVQIDTINVVERAHHHALWSRVTGYRPEMLDALQKERKVFEYWAHAMCYLPVGDHRYYRRHMEEFPEKSKWYRGYYRKYGRLAEEVLARIRAEGPLATADFEGPKRRKGQGWWDWKPAKTALEMLFYRGDLMVAGRRGFQRIYDLTERVLPGAKAAPPPGEEETRIFFARRALGALGLATEQDVNRYITIAGSLDGELHRLVREGEATEVRIPGQSKPYYVLDSLVNDLREKRGPDGRARLLSPFDNSVILRQRTRELFGMDFAMECYTPAAKRKYGYFSLPILWRNGLVGRLDPKADRGKKILLVRSLHLERPVKEASFYRALAAELERYARFNGCRSIELPKGSRGAFSGLRRHL